MSRGPGGFRWFLPGYGCLGMRASPYLDDLQVSPGEGKAGSDIGCSLSRNGLWYHGSEHLCLEEAVRMEAGTVLAGEGRKRLDRALVATWSCLSSVQFE